MKYPWVLQIGIKTKFCLGGFYVTKSCGCRNVGLNCTDSCQYSDLCTNGDLDDDIYNEVEFESYGNKTYDESDNDKNCPLTSN